MSSTGSLGVACGAPPIKPLKPWQGQGPDQWWLTLTLTGLVRKMGPAPARSAPPLQGMPLLSNSCPLPNSGALQGPCGWCPQGGPPAPALHQAAHAAQAAELEGHAGRQPGEGPGGVWLMLGESALPPPLLPSVGWGWVRWVEGRGVRVLWGWRLKVLKPLGKDVGGLRAPCFRSREQPSCLHVGRILLIGHAVWRTSLPFSNTKLWGLQGSVSRSDGVCTPTTSFTASVCHWGQAYLPRTPLPLLNPGLCFTSVAQTVYSYSSAVLQHSGGG
jgi:hypothetical protein